MSCCSAQNDCRHFVNQLVEQCTGVRNATKQAIQSYDVHGIREVSGIGYAARLKLVDFFDVEHGPAFRLAASVAHTACFSAVLGVPAAHLLRTITTSMVRSLHF